jgi:uncharacterized protein
MSSSSGALPRITKTASGIVFSVHVQPRASKNEISGLQGDEIKLRLTSPPVEDAANRLCVEFLAKRLGIAKSRVTIVAGAKSRHKTIAVEGITGDDILSLLEQPT